MDGEGQFTLLFQPTRLGTMEVRNRIVMPPMGTNFSSPDGYVTEQLKNCYKAQANGGGRQMIVEYTMLVLQTQEPRS
ncbi:MAG: hypothetical protein ACFFGZ_18645 [Candidatus Thorarchaeota archaeon]